MYALIQDWLVIHVQRNQLLVIVGLCAAPIASTHIRLNWLWLMVVMAPCFVM